MRSRAAATARQREQANPPTRDFQPMTNRLRSACRRFRTQVGTLGQRGRGREGRESGDRRSAPYGLSNASGIAEHDPSLGRGLTAGAVCKVRRLPLGKFPSAPVSATVTADSTRQTRMRPAIHGAKRPGRESLRRFASTLNRRLDAVISTTRFATSIAR